MEPGLKAVTWDAPEHHHIEKGSDWYLALAIIVVSVVVAAVLFGNILFALLLLVAGATMAIAASKHPRIIPFAVTIRGLRIGDEIFPYTTLKAYHIDEEDPRGPQLLVLSKHKFMPLLVVPLPADYVDEVEDILRDRLAEKFLQEPLSMKILELFGF